MSSAIKTMPADSAMNPNLNFANEQPNTFFVFTAFILSGTSAKKKFIKFIRAIMIMRNATANSVTVVPLLPFNPGTSSFEKYDEFNGIGVILI